MNTSTVQLQGAVPVVPVADIASAIAFYRDQLDFVVAFEQGPYAGVTRGAVTLHLDGVVNIAAFSVTCRIDTVGVDRLFAELEPRGVIDPAEPLHTMPWGARQFSVLDADGNRITFVEGA